MAQMFSAEISRHLSREDGLYLCLAEYNDSLYRDNHQRLPIPVSCTTLIRVMATNSYGTVQSSAPTSDSELCDVQLQSGQPASRQDEGSIVGNGKGFCRQSSSTEELNELKDFSFNAGLSDEKSPQQQRSTTAELRLPCVQQSGTFLFHFGRQLKDPCPTTQASSSTRKRTVLV